VTYATRLRLTAYVENTAIVHLICKKTLQDIPRLQTTQSHNPMYAGWLTGRMCERGPEGAKCELNVGSNNEGENSN